MTHTPEYQAVLDAAIEQAKIALDNKECLVAHYIKNNPNVRVEDIRFCQMQRYKDGEMYWQYWVEDVTKRNHQE